MVTVREHSVPIEAIISNEGTRNQTDGAIFGLEEDGKLLESVIGFEHEPAYIASAPWR